MTRRLNAHSAGFLLAGLMWLGQGINSTAAEISAAAQGQAFTVGTPFDLQGFIDKEVKAGARHIVVPPGRYRVTPRDRQHLLLRELKDFQIVADGVEMVCTETTRAITINRCTNVTLRGLKIDYDPLPYTQGHIVAISADRQAYEVELFEGYPDAAAVRNFKYEIFHPDTRTLRCEDRTVSKIEVLDSRHIRLTCPGRHDVQPEQVGDLIVIGSGLHPTGWFNPGGRAGVPRPPESGCGLEERQGPQQGLHGQARPRGIHFARRHRLFRQPDWERLCCEELRLRLQSVAGHPHQGQSRRDHG
jgi:hypothetical protein